MFDSLENQQGWILTLAASLMCFIGCAVIYIDLLYSKLLPKVAATYPFSISSDGKFLVSCLALSSGSLLFTSLTKLLPHASDYLASNDYLAQHTKLLDVLLLLSFLVGIGIFAGLNAVIHHFTSESIIHCSHDGHENKSNGNDESVANENNNDDSLRRMHSHSQSISISDKKYDPKSGVKCSGDYDEESAIENNDSAKHFYNNSNSDGSKKQTILASSVGSSFNDDAQKTTHTISEEDNDYHHHHYHNNNNNNSSSSSSSSNSEHKKTSSGLAQLTEHEDEDGSNEPTEETPLIVSMENPKVSDIHDDRGNRSDLKKVETSRGSVIKYKELQSFNALKYLKHPFSKKSQKLSLVAYSPSDKLDFGNLDQQQQQSQRVDFKTKGRTSSSGNEAMSIDQLMLVDEDHLQQHQLHKNDHKHKHIETSVSKLFSIGIQTTLAISLHKFPEGFIYYATSKIDQSLSLNIFLSLAIHNIAEGFSMTVPLYLAMHSRFKAILITGILGSFSQPLGALLALLVLPKDPNDIDKNQINLVFGCLMSLTSGFLTIIGLQMLISSLGFGGSSNLVTFWVVFGISVICFTNVLTGSLL